MNSIIDSWSISQVFSKLHKQDILFGVFVFFLSMYCSLMYCKGYKTCFGSSNIKYLHLFSGTGSRGLDFISPSLGCINTKLTQIGEDFCGLDVNTPLGGELPVVQEPVLTFNSHLTAVTATGINFTFE